MGKWEEKQLNEIASKITDGSHNPPKKVEVGYPMYSGRNLINGKLDFSNPSRYVDEKGFEKENKRTNIQAGDIFLSIVGSIGLTAIVPEKFDPFLIQRSIALIRTTQNSEFIRYYFESPTFQNYLIKQSRGAAQKGVYLTTLRSTKIPLPPLLEQQRIVAKLDGLFTKIDQAIGLLEENMAHTQALMGSVLDAEFGNSENKLKPIKELVVKTNTLSPKMEYSNNEFTYIDISSVNKEVFQIESPKNLLGNEAPSRARKVVEKGDIVFATTRPNLKNIAVVSEEYNNPIASTGFCLLRTKKDLLNNEYLFYFLISERLQKYIQPLIRGAQYPAISDKDLLSIEIPLLSIKEQENIVSRIKSVFDVSNSLVKTQTQKLNHLKALKSSLLDQAFKGEL